MKKLLLVLLLVCSSAFAQVVPQSATNNQGQPFLRLNNTTEYYLSCYIRDNYNYFTFRISPYTMSVWYPVYGQYVWECG